MHTVFEVEKLSTRTDLTHLDKIIKETARHLEEGKEEIYSIAENARQEREELRGQVLEVKREALEAVDKVDELEKKEKEARLHLIKVSREFDKYSEEDIREAHENAREIQMELGVWRERENQLRAKRDQLELKLKRLNETVEKAENLVTKVATALNYLLGDLANAGNKIEELQQKQELGMRVIKAQEEERKRVAREIHDGPAQSMANVVLRVEICEKLLHKQPEKVAEELAELKQLVKKSLYDVRKIIFDLRPMVLDDLGLVPALKRYISEFQQDCYFNINFQSMGNSSQERLGSALEIATFRMLQEALNNAHKHSGASNVNIFVEKTDKQLNLRIEDDGCGFELDEALKSSSGDNYGLIGIRERAELLEGEMKINTAPGEGTDIFIKIPLEKKEDREEQ